MREKESHGMSGNKYYHLWESIIQRCFNPNYPARKNYGGRGITMSPIWKVSFISFYDYISKLDYFDTGLTFDRIDNDGNYEPGNVRWIDRHIQTLNARKQSNNTSGYVGVTFCKITNKYRSTIIINRKSIELGKYETVEEGAEARNTFIIESGLDEYKIQDIR